MAPNVFLWHHPVSSYAQKVRLALLTKKIPFECAIPAGAGSGNPTILDADFASAAYPRLELPTLVVCEADNADNRFAIFDSTIILEYLEDEFASYEPILRPVSPTERARARMLEEVCDTHYEAINWGMGEIEVFERVQGGQADTMRQRAKEQLTQIHAWLEEKLGDALWFGGQEFGWADICVWPFVNRSVVYGLAPGQGTSLAAWLGRMEERDEVKTVKAAYIEGMKGMRGAREALRAGKLRREYRDHRLEWMIKTGGFEAVLDGMRNDTLRFSWP